MRHLDVQIPTADGQSNGTLHLPDGAGAGAGHWAGVLMFPDAGGVRNTFVQMGDRLASMGYVALVPDIYYWAGQWAPFDMATLFTDQQERTRLSTLAGVLTNDKIIADAGAYADFLLSRPEVTGSAIGTTGYCLGGRMSLIAAAVYVAGAIEDRSFTAEQAELLSKALTDADVQHTVEFYPAQHGFAVPDNSTYDEQAAARHWQALDLLYQTHLHGS